MKSSSLLQRYRYFFFFFLVAVGTLVILFAQNGSQALAANDAPIYQLNNLHQALKDSYYFTWANYVWLGIPYSPIPPDLNFLILRFIPFPFSLNLLFSFNLLLGGIGFYFLLHRLELTGPAKVFGALAFLFTSSNATLVFPGHINKVMTFAWIPFSMAFFLTALRDLRLMDYILCGGFLGLGLLGGEVQIPFYTGLWYCVFTVLFLIYKAYQKQLKAFDSMVVLSGLAIIALTSLITGFSVTVHSLQYMSENTVAVSTDNSKDMFNFATQFFFPPEELISFITTIQFFGGPGVYWGRDGVTTLAGHSTSALRLSDDYMGLLPLGCAIVGAVSLWRLWQVRMFIIMCLGSLLISFGKEGFLFWVLYHLPTMKSQRNPHRWTYFVAFGVCALAAYGFQSFWERLQSRAKNEIPDAKKSASSQNVQNKSPFQKKPRWILLITGWSGVLLFTFAGLFINHPEFIATFHYSSEQLASPEKAFYIERTLMLLMSLFRTGFFLALSASSIWWIIYAKTREKSDRPLTLTYTALSFLILVTVSDLAMNAKRYILLYPWKERFENNEVAKALSQDHDLFRVKATGVNENETINDLVSNVLPYFHISVVDPTSASRVPVDYSNFFSYIENHYVRTDRYYDFFNVKYLISSQQMTDPNTKFQLLGQAPKLFLYQRSDFMPRAWLAPSAAVIENPEEALAKTLSMSFPFRSSVVLEEKPDLVPVQNVFTAKDFKSVIPVTFESYEVNYLQIKANATSPSLLVLGEKWDPDWKAWVDGKPVKIYRANYLMRAVEIPQGEHTVRMEYRPSTSPMKLSLVSIMVIFLGSSVVWLSYRLKK